MSEPEVKFEIDEHGRIGYRVTNEGVLLSKDEKEFIIDHVTRMQEENAKLREELEVVGTAAYLYGRDDLKAENAKLRELVRDVYRRFHGVVIENWSYSSEDFYTYEQRMRELGIEVEP